MKAFVVELSMFVFYMSWGLIKAFWFPIAFIACMFTSYWLTLI